MRMTASWSRSGPIGRIQVCGAIERACGELPPAHTPPPRSDAVPAARQARRRARLRQQPGAPLPLSARLIPPRPTRWAAAVAALIALQNEYRAWLEVLPDNLEGSRLAEKPQAI